MVPVLVQKLVDLGLSDKETSVYLALIQGSEMTAEQAATLTKLNRSTTYVQLKLLMDRGLASTFKRGKKTFFAAESPSNLLRLVEQKRELILKQETEIKSIVGDLLKLKGIDGDEVPVTNGMVTCAEAKFGRDRVVAIRNGASLSMTEKVGLLTCYN